MVSIFSNFDKVKARLRRRGHGECVDAHEHSANHRAEIESSRVVGCFYCCDTYSPDLIDEWIDDGQCAMCPKCGIDAVIGDASGYPVTDKQFLSQMNKVWFS